MSMKMEIIVFGMNYYDMTKEGGQKGATVRVLGDEVDTNNKFGVEITDAEIDFSEIDLIREHNLPAKFKVNYGFVSIRKKNNKEVAAARLSKFEYVCAVEIKDKKNV